jgi:hypothetical protein
MTRPRRSLLVPLHAALLWVNACSSTSSDDLDPGVSGGQTGSETYGCLPVSSEALGADQASPIGVSANQALAPFVSHERGQLSYARSGGSVDYRLLITQASTARFEEREWRSDGSGIELALDCEDALVVPVTVELSTDDGAFAERWDAELTRSASGFASISVQVELAALAGDYELDAVDTRNADGVRVLFDVSALGSSVGGSIAAQITESSGDVASAREVPIATFPSPPE